MPQVFAKNCPFSSKIRWDDTSIKAYITFKESKTINGNFIDNIRLPRSWPTWQPSTLPEQSWYPTEPWSLWSVSCNWGRPQCNVRLKSQPLKECWKSRPSLYHGNLDKTFSSPRLSKLTVEFKFENVRVCGEENAARQIVELEGIERLAQLVRDPRERNYSDGVLVACLVICHSLLQQTNRTI